MFSIEKLSRNCSSFEELIASKLNLNYIHNIAKAITPCCATSTRSPYLIIWWRQTDVMMPRWIVHEKQLSCFNNNRPKSLSEKSRNSSLSSSPPFLPPGYTGFSSFTPSFSVFDRSFFVSFPVNASTLKTFQRWQKTGPFLTGAKIY